jgi:3-oxoacyl-[acyl-carrier-protein] synthase II
LARSLTTKKEENILNNSIRVAVTGTGTVSPLGLDTSTMWEALIAGKSGIAGITLFDASKLETRFAGEVKGFDPNNYVDRKEARHMDRFTQLAVAASLEAVKQSGLKIDENNQDNIGILIGSGIGGIITLAEQIKVMVEKGPGRVSPFLVPMMIGDAASAQVSIVLGAKGPNFCAMSACSSGADSIGVAYEIIKRGDAVAMLAGGSESIMTPIAFAGFNSCKALSTHNDAPQQASRPFDAERDGFVVGEGAGVLVLEEMEYARKRGAKILAEMIAYGASGDAYHITQPAENGEGAVRAMQMALGKAGIAPEMIDYINAHGTSTPLNDRMETRAIKAAFGDYAYKVPISSTKSMTGHLIGAAGAIEAAFCALAIRDGVIPPTINLRTPDPECDLDYVPNKARKKKIKTALSNSFGFGGHNSTLILRRVEEGGR